MSPRRHLTAMITATVLALAAPAAAFAQGNPFTPLPQAAPEQVQTTQTRTSGPDDDGLERWQQILIFGGGVVLLGGIAFAILSDARRRAPVSEGELVTATPGQGSHKHASKQRSRKKAKAARASRRRNR